MRGSEWRRKVSGLQPCQRAYRAARRVATRNLRLVPAVSVRFRLFDLRAVSAKIGGF